jgi:hypothetical protein
LIRFIPQQQPPKSQSTSADFSLFNLQGFVPLKRRRDDVAGDFIDVVQ